MPNNPPKAKKQRTKTVYARKSDVFYSSGSWTKLRNQYREGHPICERCLYRQRISIASTRNLSVHHIRRQDVYPELALDCNNLLTLCSPCHHGHFDKLERSGKEQQAIEEGEMIKNNSSVSK